MSLFNRYNIAYWINQDLEDQKMIFIGGPRQVGKTTLAQQIAEQFKYEVDYLNWDFLYDRIRIDKAVFQTGAELLIFDELHKYSSWKNYIKGVYDKYKNIYKIIVTGSARLNVYRRGGDSLMGRYHYITLHPLSLNEILNNPHKQKIGTELRFPKTDRNSSELTQQLLEFGGFPEPFFKKSQRYLKRWHNQRVERLINEDIRDVSLIRDLSSLQLLTQIIPSRVASLLSINSLREDLRINYNTLASYIEILERFYFIYRIYPLKNTLTKSLKKEPKVYLWDWSSLNNPGQRLENFVASQLHKYVSFLKEIHGENVTLNFWRDFDNREVDFVITVNDIIWLAIEVKSSDTKASNHLKYFRNKFDVKQTLQVVNIENIDVVEDGIRIISLDKFLLGLT